MKCIGCPAQHDVNCDGCQLRHNAQQISYKPEAHYGPSSVLTEPLGLKLQLWAQCQLQVDSKLQILRNHAIRNTGLCPGPKANSNLRNHSTITYLQAFFFRNCKAAVWRGFDLRNYIHAIGKRGQLNVFELRNASRALGGSSVSYSLQFTVGY